MKLATPAATALWPNRARARGWYRACRAVPTARVALAVALVPLLPVLGVALGGGRLGTAQGVLLALCLGTATATDLLWRRIFNWLVVGALGWVLALHLVAPAGAAWVGLPTAAGSLAGGAGCFGAMLLLYLAFRGGEGDVKLMAAVGALVGPWHGLEALMFGYLLAAGAATVVLGCRATGRGRTVRALPMAPFFAAGTALTLALPNGLPG